MREREHSRPASPSTSRDGERHGFEEAILECPASPYRRMPSAAGCERSPPTEHAGRAGDRCDAAVAALREPIEATMQEDDVTFAILEIR
jgi:hypothetical protein